MRPRLRGLVSVALPPLVAANLLQRIVARLLLLRGQLRAELPRRLGLRSCLFGHCPPAVSIYVCK